MSPRFLTGLLLLALVLTGCDLFSTRDAESPEEGAPPMGGAGRGRRRARAISRMRSCSTTRLTTCAPSARTVLIFEADAVALSLYPALQGWDFTAESQMASQLFSSGVLPADCLLVVVFAARNEEAYTDSTLIRADYNLTAHVAVSGVPREMTGTAEFVLRKGRESYWQIYRWRDFRAGEQPSWSEFKSLVSLGR